MGPVSCAAEGRGGSVCPCAQSSLPRTPSRRRKRAPAGQASEFSDAVSVQIPSQVPAERPEALFHFRRPSELGGPVVLRSGRSQPPAVHRPRQRGYRSERHRRSHRCGELRPGGMVGHLQAAASRHLGRPVPAGTVSTGRLLGLGRALARAGQPARSHDLVLHLRRAGGGPLGIRADGQDRPLHSCHRTGRRRLGPVALPRSSPASNAQPRASEAGAIRRTLCTRASTFPSITQTIPTAPSPAASRSARRSPRNWSAATSTRPSCTTIASGRWSTRCPRNTSTRSSSNGSGRSTTA